MVVDVSILVGGEAGQGIQTVGDLLSRACLKSGLHLMAINDFESRIRGGHSFFQIRISDQPVGSPDYPVHLIVALNQETVDLHEHELAEGGLIVLDGEETDQDSRVRAIPITRMAEEAGGRIMANTAAAGVCLALCGAPFEPLREVLGERFSRADAKVLENNLQAAEAGFRAANDMAFSWSFQWPMDGEKGVLRAGARALALGALAADCRLAAFYPMSPSTGIMANLAEFSDSAPLVVEQAEDEIAAVNMVIGASFAGVRALTATSGGGFCLMTEGLGLAGITETPLVIINAQRPGPATGLPTRTAQADLLFVIRAAQDEFPRFVFAPASADDAFGMVIRAFDLAWKYQVPAIILVDQFFTDSITVSAGAFEAPETIRRYVIGDADMADPEAYKRYAYTKSGVSPRSLPCMGKALVGVSGNEHREDGHISEKAADRTAMMEKRFAKTPYMLEEMRPPEGCHAGSGNLLVGWGSSFGAIREAADFLREEGHDVGCLHFSDLWPFPCEAARSAIENKEVFTVEQNATGQFRDLLRGQTGIQAAGSILKYDGRPLFAREIAAQWKKLMGYSHG